MIQRLPAGAVGMAHGQVRDHLDKSGTSVRLSADMCSL